MDQSTIKQSPFPHGLLIFALALLLLPGCAWAKGLTASKPGKVPTDPERREIADSNAGQKAVASADLSVAKSDSVKLDGSASGNDAPAIPNAPGVAGSQILTAGPAANDLSAGLPKSFDRSLDKQDDDEAALAQPADEAVVATSSTADSGTAGKTILTADDRGEDDRSASGRKRVDKPAIPKADESLTSENSVLEFEGAGVMLKNGQVAATVNGQPIFAEDVLKQIPLEQANGLARAQAEASPEEFREVRQHIIKMNIEQHIERELLLQALKSKLKEDVLNGIRKQIDANFNTEYLPLAIKHAGVTTESEFEEALHKQGSSIDVLRSQFRNRELEKQYLGSKALPKSGFDRPEVLKYYQEHKEDYRIRAQAKWEQIRLSYSKNGGKERARKKAEEILERLENDEEFAAIARECSDGPRASSKGGLRGWTVEGSLKDKEIERALFEQPVGEIGPPIETEDSIDIVRVIDRDPSSYEAFPAVEDDIRTTLKNNLWQKASRALVNDLRKNATIETFIDKL
jgi:hypothetical protein